jgi:hypothetical protein
MTVIWKYQLKTTDVNYINMPKGAQVLTVSHETEITT